MAGTFVNGAFLMNLKPARLALLSLSVVLALSACKQGNDTAPAAAGAATLPGAAAPAGDRISAEITGAGATFIFPLISKWSADYHAQTGNKVNYQSIGSSGGVRQIRAKTVAFGASDAPVKGEDLDKDGMVQFPAIIGGTVPVLNLDGFKPGELRVNGPVLAEMFLGSISKWNVYCHLVSIEIGIESRTN